MLNLFLENCRYISRSRMVYLILVFSSLVHYGGMKFINQLTVSIQGVVSILGPKEAMYTALFLQIFTALSISSVYGIWIAPYAHRGDRSVLTHMLPVSKNSFPICYILCSSLLLLINFGVMLTMYSLVYGSLFSSSNPVSLLLLLKAFCFELLCLEVVMLGLAVSSMYFGQVASVFIGGSFLFVLQILGTFARLFKENIGSATFSLKRLFIWGYHSLPPIGDFIFDIKNILTGESLPFHNLLLWIAWLLILIFIFRFKIRFPTQNRSTEA